MYCSFTLPTPLLSLTITLYQVYRTAPSENGRASKRVDYHFISCQFTRIQNNFFASSLCSIFLKIVLGKLKKKLIITTFA